MRILTAILLLVVVLTILLSYITTPSPIVVLGIWALWARHGMKKRRRSRQ